jgi:subtilisin family serine protease
MDHTPSGMTGRAGRLASLTVFLVTAGLIGPGVGTAQAGQIGTAAPAAPVEAAVLDQVADGGQTTFWVVLDQQANLSTAAAIADWDTRGAEVYDELTSTAGATQAGLRTLLTNRGVEFEPFWIVNAIQVTGDQVLVAELAARPEVGEIVASRTYQIPEQLPAADPPTINAVEWGVDRIGAPDVWDTFDARGEGIVVGIIDTGGSFDHPALVNQYRGNLGGGSFDHDYSWHDPSSVCGTPSLVPCDNHGHGTHVTGTVLGDDGGSNQVGVAPQARWIAAKGCEGITNECTDSALLSSGQFMVAPTDLNGQNPRPDLRPHVVNNSWGGDPDTDPWYQGIVDSWVAAGIFPQFANGNSNGVAACGSSSNPGNLPASYAAGAFDINNNIANFSNRGPSAWDSDLIKPNISAPGVNVRSSVPGGGYGSASGTSMASPHVAGAVALLWSAAPELTGDIEATRSLLDQTAIDVENLTCGGTAENNNVWGQGRLDIFAAVSEALGAAGDPAIEVTPDSLAIEQPAGTVTDESLTIANVGDGVLDWTVFTDEPQQLPTGATPVEAAAVAPEGAIAGAGLSTQRRLLGGTFGPPAVATPESAPAQDGEITITHSASQAIVALNSVACSSDGGISTTENGYLRHFVLGDFGITSDFGVTQVSFGIENLTVAQAVTVNLYTMVNPAGSFTYGNFQEIGSASASLSAQQATIVPVPVTGTAPAGSTLVVEVDVPDMSGVGGLFIGSNPDGQTAPSYLRSASCGLSEPTDTAAIGFPGMQIVMNVTGTTDVEEPVCGSPTSVPWLSVSPASGSTAAGDSSEVTVSVDSTGLELGEYEAVLCVVSNDPATPLVQVPVSLTVVEDGGGGEPVVCDTTIMGVHAGPLTVSEGVTCLAAGSQVLGEINVLQGAGLIATAAVVQGPISAIGATVVEVAFSQVTGPVLVSGATGNVSLFASQVTGSVSLLTSATPAASTVSGNTIIGSLSCFGNVPAPTDHGLPNTATGGKLGQCADL